MPRSVKRVGWDIDCPYAEPSSFPGVLSKYIGIHLFDTVCPGLSLGFRQRILVLHAVSQLDPGRNTVFKVKRRSHLESWRFENLIRCYIYSLTSRQFHILQRSARWVIQSYSSLMVHTVVWNENKRKYEVLLYIGLCRNFRWCPNHIRLEGEVKMNQRQNAMPNTWARCRQCWQAHMLSIEYADIGYFLPNRCYKGRFSWKKR